MREAAESGTVVPFERAVSIGDNGAPFDFLEFFDLVVNSSATTTEKLLALVTGRHIGKDGKPAYPSRTRIMQQASCSENTFQRSLGAMRLFFEVEQRRGRATLYSPKPIVTVDEIEAALEKLRPKSTPQNGVHPKTIPQDGASFAQSAPQNGGGVHPKMGRQNDPLKEEKERTVPDGTGGEPPEATLRELVWTKCISWLLPRSCLDEARLRVRVGKWVQEFGAGAVIDAVAIAQKEAPVSIMAYVEGILRRKAARPTGSANLAPWEIAHAEKMKREEDAMEQMREYQLQRQRERERVR